MTYKVRVLLASATSLCMSAGTNRWIGEYKLVKTDDSGSGYENDSVIYENGNSRLIEGPDLPKDEKHAGRWSDIYWNNRVELEKVEFKDEDGNDVEGWACVNGCDNME